MTGQRIGYVRVSTLDQSTARQLDGIELDRVFEDKASGKDIKRPELERMIDFARDGDTVLVHSMDRLARNLEDLRAIVRRLTVKKVRVEFVKEQLAFTGEDNAMANLLVNVMGAFAEFERSLIRKPSTRGHHPREATWRLPGSCSLARRRKSHRATSESRGGRPQGKPRAAVWH